MARLRQALVGQRGLSQEGFEVYHAHGTEHGSLPPLGFLALPSVFAARSAGPGARVTSEVRISDGCRTATIRKAEGLFPGVETIKLKSPEYGEFASAIQSSDIPFGK